MFRRASITSLGIVLSCWSTAAAQAPRPDSIAPRLSIDAGLGLAGSSGLSMAGYKMNISVGLPERHAVILRYTKVQEYCLFDACDFPSRSAEAAVMYGWRPLTRRGGATIAGGAAVLTSLRSDNPGFGDPRSRSTEPAFPIEIAGYVEPGASLALGLAVMADLAPEHSIAGLFLSIRINFD
jgi:hypothetical protein